MTYITLRNMRNLLVEHNIKRINIKYCKSFALLTQKRLI